MRKADEMEMHIALRSTRLAWAFTVVYLLIWIWYEFIKGGDFWPQFILICSQGMVFWASQLVLRKVMAGNNEEQD